MAAGPGHRHAGRTGARRGRPAADPRDAQIARLRKEKAKLEQELAKAPFVVDVQSKLQAGRAGPRRVRRRATGRAAPRTAGQQRLSSPGRGLLRRARPAARRCRRIPLEYFASALAWLARQPGVDPARIAVLGVSRGSEAAQLLGVYYPTLVHAVIASVPSNVALCSYPGCTGPAWTLHGQAVPYTSEFDNPSPADNPAAVIPDQRIQGPVFLDCGEADQTWTSCPYAQAILSLLDAHHDPWAHVLYAYPGAGHPVGTLVPYEPTSPVADPDYATDQQARALLWPHLLTFLAGLVHNPAS